MYSTKFNVNAADAEYGHTALHHACMRGHHIVAEILVNTEGVKIDAVDNNGNNALHHASLQGFPVVVTLLLGKDDIKNKINDKNTSGKTALFCACLKQLPQFLAVVRLLLDTDGIDATLAALDGSMALHAASFVGNIEAVRLLVGLDGLPVNAPRGDGRRAIDLALVNSKFETVALLQQHGATFSLPFPEPQINPPRNHRPVDDDENPNELARRRLHLKFLR
jgi:ankyrin repeat protein